MKTNTFLRVCLLASALVAGESLFGAIRAITPDNYGSPNSWQIKRHNEKMAVVTNGGSKVVFIGDSITHIWEGGCKAIWDKYFAGEPYKALNLGISADRTEHVLWRITGGRELDGYEAKCILLMIGTNNTGHFTADKEPPCDTIIAIREILRTIRRKQPKAKIVLMPIFPRGGDWADACRRRNAIVNKEIMKFANGTDLFWVDFSQQFMTVDGRLSPELFPDLLHPEPLACEIWASAVKPYIDYALSDGRLPSPLNRYAPFIRPENDRFSAPAASTAATSHHSWWFDRMLRNRNQISESKGAIDLVFLGDSITHGWEDKGGETLAELRKTYSVLSAGYSGDKTENVLWRCENGELDGYKATCITLMIGTNNTWYRDDRPEHIAGGVKAILATIARKQPQAVTLLMAIPPFGQKPDHPFRAKNTAANEMMKGYADGKKVIWIDLGPKLLDEKGESGKYLPDFCHPNALGYKEVWLPALLPHFKAACGK